jgi:hypothetical protein
MRWQVILMGVAATLSSMTLVSISSASGPIFRDDFDGTSLDPAIWTVDMGDGQIEVGGGVVTLTCPGATFPVVTSVPGLFPATGDFVVRAGMQYLSQARCGDGFGAMDNFWENYLGAGVCRPFLIWQDGAGVHVYSGSVGNTVLGPAPDLNYHVFEWTYMNGTYYFSLDGAPRASGTCATRATQVFFGHPHPVGCSPWTSFAIDFIEVMPAGATEVLRASWSKVKAIYR